MSQRHNGIRKRSEGALYVARCTDEECRCEIRRGLARWLSDYGRIWAGFCTLTFRDGVNIRLRTAGLRIMDGLRKATGHTGFTFLVREYGRRTGRTHYHALVGCHDNGLEVINRLWRQLYGIAHVTEYQRCRGAEQYCAKYILKEQDDIGEWDIFGTPPTWEERFLPRSLYSEREEKDAPWLQKPRQSGWQLYTTQEVT